MHQPRPDKNINGNNLDPIPDEEPAPAEIPSHGEFPAPPMPEVLARPSPNESSRPTTPLARSSAIQTGKVFAIGMDFVYGVVGCAALGWLADWWFKTGPLWLLIGAGIGLLVAMYRFVREGLKLAKGSGNPDSPPRGKSK